MDEGEPHVLLVGDDGASAEVERGLRGANLRLSTVTLTEPIMAAAGEIAPDVVVVAYRAEIRHRAWNVLTVLRGSRELRAIPVVVVTDDAEEADLFRDRFAGIGIAVLIDPDDATLVAEVTRRAAP